MKSPSLFATGLLLAAAFGCLWLGPTDVTLTSPVLIELRLPRVLAALVVGAGMALSGVAMQALLGNPLADPFILGLSSGASLGVILALVLLPSLGASFVPLSVAASVGALAAAALVFTIARGRGGLLPATRLLLSGVALAAALGSIAAFLLQVAPADRALRASLYFSAGSLASARVPALLAAGACILAAALWMRRRSRDLDRLLLGERTALSLGVPTQRLRRTLLVGSSLITGLLVAVSGPVGFVGLVAPHLARLLVGPGHRRLAPLAMLFGATMLLAADTAGRTLFQPREIPAGLLTAATGGPFFLWLLSRRTYGFGGTDA